VRLRQLDGQFIRYEMRIDTWERIKADVFAAKPTGPYTDDEVEEVTGPRAYHIDVATLAEADGLSFLCPKCFAENRGPVGTHTVICWFEGKVPDDAVPGPGRWNPVGTGLDDLSFVPGKRSPSVLLTGDGCAWHGFVTAGDAT
jgi:hypothetical protein